MNIFHSKRKTPLGAMTLWLLYHTVAMLHQLLRPNTPGKMENTARNSYPHQM